MSIDELKEKYNLELSYRDSVPTALFELERLMEEESVQRFCELSSFLSQHQKLNAKSDDEILDSLIENDESLHQDGEETYFCYGHHYNGYPKKVGGYYISKPGPFNFNQGIKVARYRNLYKPQDEQIIPTSELGEFESRYHIVFSNTSYPEKEYQNTRRRLYREAMKEKQYTKKAGDSHE